MFALKVIANLGRTTDALTSAQARFIEESFYIVDGMSSLPEPQEVVELLVAVVSYLKEFGLEAHKVVSNSREVMEAIGHSDEGAPPLINLDPNSVPRALGVTWKLEQGDGRPFCRHGHARAAVHAMRFAGHC